MQLWCKDGVNNKNFIQTVQIKIRTGCNNLVLPNRNTYLMGTEDVINIQGFPITFYVTACWWQNTLRGFAQERVQERLFP